MRASKRTSARAPACQDRWREPRLVASVEGVQLKLQRVVRLALEYVRGGAAEGRRLALLVLTLGAPVGGAVDDLVIACACRKSNPNILVVQPAQDRAAKNGPGQFDGARDRRILLQR